MPKRFLTAALLICAGALGCESVPDPLEITIPGGTGGVVFLDRNASGTLDPGDRAFGRVDVQLVDFGSGRVVATETADSAGVFVFESVPVGRYRYRIAPAQLGDSVFLSVGADTVVSVVAADSLAPIVRLGVTYPTVTIAQARALPVGKPVFVLGRVAALFGDTLHVWDGNRAIRGLRTTATATITVDSVMGDSVRVFGRTARATGLPALDSASLTPLASRPPVDPVAIQTAEIGGAGGGTLDAAPARIENATILDTITTSTGASLVRVSDGSGTGDVWLGIGVLFRFTAFQPGTVLRVSGILVPSPVDSTTWALRPRSGDDITVVTTDSPLRPAAPTGAVATAVDSTVTLTWTDASANETVFRIERRPAVIALWSEVGTVGAGVTTFTQTVAGNSGYIYRVRACNGLICSAYSNEAPVATIPAAPSNLIAAGGSRLAFLSWRDNSPVDAETRVERRDGSAGTFAQVAVVGPNVQNYNDSGVPPGVATYRVRACNAAGCSAYSNEVSVTVFP